MPDSLKLRSLAVTMVDDPAIRETLDGIRAGFVEVVGDGGAAQPGDRAPARATSTPSTSWRCSAGSASSARSPARCAGDRELERLGPVAATAEPAPSLGAAMTSRNQGHKWLTLAAMCFGLFLIMLDNTIVNVALPSIQRELDASPSTLEWTINAYVLSFAVLIMLGGKLGDRFGRKKPVPGGPRHLHRDVGRLRPGAEHRVAGGIPRRAGRGGAPS